MAVVKLGATPFSHLREALVQLHVRVQLVGRHVVRLRVRPGVREPAELAGVLCVDVKMP